MGQRTNLLSSRYFRPDGTNLFAFFPKVLNINGAMVVIVKEHKNEYTYPNFNVGFLLGPEKLEGESAFSRWVSTEEFMQHQPQYDEKYDDIFAHAFDALTILSGTMHFVNLLS